MFVLQNCKYPCGLVAVDFASLRGFNLVLETNFGSDLRLTDIRTLNSFFFIKKEPCLSNFLNKILKTQIYRPNLLSL